ncbi:MAG: hypothetical protein WKF82_06360 [Nocardioidaceae bacterium]
MVLFSVRAPKPGRPGRILVPSGFEALLDALGGSGDLMAVMQEIGRRTALEGAALDDVLDDLARAYRCAGGMFHEPPFEVVKELATAWADASLRYLHAVSCEDPLTGLATLAHVRTRVGDIYREASRTGTVGATDFAFLVVELNFADGPSSPLDRVLRMVDLSELIRKVYTGEEAIGQLSASRAVVVIRRDERLGEAVGSLLGLLHDWHHKQGGLSARLWIEGLPGAAASAEVLLDELAR